MVNASLAKRLGLKVRERTPVRLAVADDRQVCMCVSRKSIVGIGIGWLDFCS